MHGPMQHHRRPLSFQSGPVKMNPRDGSALERIANRDDLCVRGICRSEIVEKLDVLAVSVVGVKPGSIGGAN